MILNSKRPGIDAKDEGTKRVGWFDSIWLHGDLDLLGVDLGVMLLVLVRLFLRGDSLRLLKYCIRNSIELMEY